MYDVRKRVPVFSVLLGETTIMVQNGVNHKDANALVWYHSTTTRIIPIFQPERT
jgi:hypothetical protein